MLRFALRHFTAILIFVALAAWAIFYLPDTPSWTVVQLKQAIDAHDGNGAAQHVDFESVVRHAGHEMVSKQGGASAFGKLLGQAAVDIFVKPMAQLVQSAAVDKVNEGAPEVQMPGAATAGAIVLMHRSGDTAFTKFKDSKGQEWGIHIARGDDGRWRVTEIDNIDQLIEKIKRSEQKQFNSP